MQQSTSPACLKFRSTFFPRLTGAAAASSLAVLRVEGASAGRPAAADASSSCTPRVAPPAAVDGTAAAAAPPAAVL